MIKHFAADKNGNMTIDPDEVVSLFPAGSFKGYGPASMVEIICGVYTGMGFGREIIPMYTAPINQPKN